MPLYNSAIDDPAVIAAYQAFAETSLQLSQPEQKPASADQDQSVMASYEAMANIAQQSITGQSRVHTIKNGLNGGEISREAGLRFDLPRYQLGCESLLNMIPILTGGITKRPGLRFIASLGQEAEKTAQHTRLIPFVYSASLQFMLLFTFTYKNGSCKVKWIDRDGLTGLHDGPSLPYRGEEIFELSYAQCGNTIYLAHHNHKPAKLVCQSISETGGPDFKYELVDFKIKAEAPASINAAWNGGWDWDICRKQWHVATAIDKDTGEESLPCQPFESFCPEPNATIGLINITVSPVANALEYRIYKRQGGSYGYIGRLVPGQGDGDSGMEFYDTGQQPPDMADPPPANPENCLDSPGDFPSLVFIHQQRLGWAASDNDPLTIWLSQTSNFECRAAKSPPNDDDAIEVTLAATEANQILWAVPDRSGLAIGTEGGEWYLTGADGSGAITPNSLSFQAQTHYGSEPDIPPVRCEKNLVFCQRGARHVRDFGYSFQADKYEASDLTLLASHLFRFTQIKSWAWQANPDCILWITTRAGQLLGVSYMPEQEITAWHRHESPYADFHSVATLADSEGRSRLWAVVLRNSGGSLNFGLEMLEPRFQGLTSLDWDRQEPGEIAKHLDGPERLPFRARCIPCIPETGMQEGTSCLRIRKINAIKARVVNCEPFSCIVKSQNTRDTERRPVPINSRTPQAKKYGRLEYAEEADWPCVISAGWREGAKLELIFDGEKVATVLGISIDMEVAAEGGGQI